VSKNYRQTFQALRNYLAGRVIGATRDSALLGEVVKCLFCYAELSKNGEDLDTSDEISLARSYRSAFREILKKFPSLFERGDEILLDPHSLHYTHLALAGLEISSDQHDPVGDAYQAFVGSEIRGNEGQFFTPTAAVSWLVRAIDPKPGERVIDPACGSGAFLGMAAAHMRMQGASPAELREAVVGIEKDSYLAMLARQHLSLSLGQEATIHSADALSLITTKGKKLPKSLLGSFDVLLANPPFGAKINSADDGVRRQFQLAHKWKRDKDGSFRVESDLSTRTSPQIMFVERILSLLKPGGRAGLVLPESLISSPKHAYVVHYLLEHADILSVVGMPESLFKTSGKGGTHTKTCLILLTKKNPSSKTHRPKKLYIAEAIWCGHDSRGNTVPKDDLPIILKEYTAGEQKRVIAPSKKGGSIKQAFGIWIQHAEIKDLVLAPRYYDPQGSAELAALSTSHEMVRFGDLIDAGAITYTTGVEVGKLSYGTGDIPFIRTSDISGWELKLDPKHCVSEEVYANHAQKLDVRENDILMVKDGTYLIGTCALISKYDEKILFQSHLYKIRVHDSSVITPEVLLALLSSEPVQRQIRAKRQTQDIIDSLGTRIRDLILPIPRSVKKQRDITNLVRKVIEDRIEARELSRKARVSVVQA